MLGRVTASQTAAAFAASFLLRLPLMRYGVTNLGAIMRSVWPNVANSRGQWWAGVRDGVRLRGHLSGAGNGAAGHRLRCTGQGSRLRRRPGRAFRVLGI